MRCVVSFLCFAIFATCSKACIDGWIEHNGICYFLSHDKVTWFEGLAVCSAVFGSLAEPNTRDIQQFLLSQIPKVNTSGCVDDHTNCAYWARIGECNKNPAYMLQSCKKSCHSCDTSVPTEDEGTCVDNNKFCQSWASQGECSTNPAYMMVSCKKSCKACNGSSSEPLSMFPYWIGASDAFRENQWLFSSKQTSVNTAFWYPGQPDNKVVPGQDNTDEDCALFNWDGKGAWGDYSCTSRFLFMCQKKNKDTNLIG